MGNFARKIMDAVQNLFLDKLVLRTFPLWPVGSFWDERNDGSGSGIVAWMLLVMLGLFGIGWVLGAVANRRPRPTQGPLDRLQQGHSNGFEAWSEEPAGGLHPPAPLRWLVMGLGSRRDRPEWTFLIEFMGFMLAFALLWALANLSDSFWSGLHPMLSNALVRDTLWIGATAFIVFVALRLWAGEQRDRLEPPPDPRSLPRSDWATFLIFSVFAVGMTAMVGFSLEWPRWSAAIPLLPLVVVACVPRWRHAFNDAVFGKQTEPAARRPGKLSQP